MNIDVANKKVLIRVDFNVPLDENYDVADDTRIKGALPTIQYVLSNGGAPILMSHLGRPLKELKENGEIDFERFTLENLIPAVSDLTGEKVKFCPETVGEVATKMSSELQPGQILLLENTRFNKGEEKGDPDFAKQLADLGDVYINDAFGAAHREHASTATIARYFDKDHKSLGFLMESEVKAAHRLMDSPERPYTAIVGGAKVSDKIPLLENLIPKVDKLIIGGGMAYTFIKAQGGSIGKSICEDDKLDLALELLEKAAKAGTEVFLPSDTVIADDFSPEANTDIAPTREIPDDWEGLDIGPESRATFKEAILPSKSILWNGPMGVFEMDIFAEGTNAIAEAVAEATDAGAYSMIGGGDSASAINKAGLADRVSHVSTGGGAMLELLEGKKLPGLEAMES